MATNIIILCIALAPACVIAFGKYSENIIRLIPAINPQDSEYVRSKLLENVISQLEKDIVKSEIDGGIYDAAAQYGPQMKMSEREPAEADYDDTGAVDPNAMPSIRDNEYVQHGPLWGAQYMSGSASEGMYTLNLNSPTKNKNEVKTHGKVTLPAYCNPPNPCPVGYTNEDGCIMDFENTAAFSRDYQESQECMCDFEHMFDCAGSKAGIIHSVDFNDFMRKLQADNDHKSLVAKNVHVKKDLNPYLQEEFVPIAAKKGINIGS